MTPPIVVMGVSGSGKSTVGTALAARLHVEFQDADELHPPANVAKMAAGIALEDSDRQPWLERVGDWLEAHPDGGVVACSALRRRYRDTLRAHAPAAVFLHLHCDPDLLATRVARRTDHFMPASLVESQLATLEPLEPDEAGLVLDCDAPTDQVVDRFIGDLADDEV